MNPNTRLIKRTNWDAVPRDPLLYRLYEILLVYGYPFKHIIHEKFGEDGIMSAIDFNAHIEKVENPKGDRVKITRECKAQSICLNSGVSLTITSRWQVLEVFSMVNLA